MSRTRTVGLVVLVVATVGCQDGREPWSRRVDPPTPVTVAPTPEQQQEIDRLTALAASAQGLTADALVSSHAVPFATRLGYDPTAAENLPLVQASPFALEPPEMELLAKNGFVVTSRPWFSHFAYGYEAIYAADLPVFISADSILQAVAQSYDVILARLETGTLLPAIRELLVGMRASLEAAPTLDPTRRRDADLFLTVALSLLEGGLQPSVTDLGGFAQDLYEMATAASGSSSLVLFGTAREIDFSQFTPRGHYTSSETLKRYFRAMMWLGRIDFPLVHTDPTSGVVELARHSVEDAFALRSLMDPAALARWTAVDAVLRAFVGEPDSMQPPDVDRLAADLGMSGYDLRDVSDQALAGAIVAGAYGTQKILSQIVLQPPHAGETWPLDATFLLMGQRYVLDSHVFSNVVYDRVAAYRMMPSPLDVAYAALANDQAAQLLAPELATYEYAPELETMRLLGDAHGTAFWEANLYNLWLNALRALSPGPSVGAGAALPAVATTEPWGRRLLRTQLASWAQLRHNTILYAKQSYTLGATCEFPDGYVDPYPAFYAQLEKLGAAGSAMAAALPIDAGSVLTLGSVRTYFDRLGEVAGMLKSIAEHQQTGLPLEPAQLEFINRAVRTTGGGCGGGPVGLEGWYADLFFDPSDAPSYDPTIADVHTQPTDEAGNFVGRVLHVGTGWPRTMVVTVETCVGPRAYVGLVSSYYEVVTEGLQRLTDEKWKWQIGSSDPPHEVPWVADLSAP